MYSKSPQARPLVDLTLKQFLVFLRSIKQFWTLRQIDTLLLLKVSVRDFAIIFRTVFGIFQGHVLKSNFSFS